MPLAARKLLVELLQPEHEDDASAVAHAVVHHL